MERKTITLNPKRHLKAKHPKKELLNTIIHENAHLAHPKMWEKNIRKLTTRYLKRSSPAKKAKIINKSI